MGHDVRLISPQFFRLISYWKRLLLDFFAWFLYFNVSSRLEGDQI